MFPYLQSNLGGHSFLIPLCYIQEICPSEPFSRETIPDTFLLGQKEVRKQTVPLLRHSTWLGDQVVDCPFSHLILFSLHGTLVGLPASRSGRIVRIADEEFQQPPKLFTDSHGILGCWTDQDDHVYPLLDIHHLVRRRVEDTEFERSDFTICISSSDRELFEPYATLLNDMANNMGWEFFGAEDNLTSKKTGRMIIRALGPDALRNGIPFRSASGRSEHLTVFLTDETIHSRSRMIHLYCQGADYIPTGNPTNFIIAVKQAWILSKTLSAK